ncbi:MAG: ribosome recycling factor [Clostridia bacterium]|nr:ribosome recycling factor [Clostridia bacterium]
MLKDIIFETEEKMKKTIEAMKKELSTMRVGRANPSILEKIQVEYYGTMTPVNQVANISVPEPRLIIVQPWDKTLVAQVEKAILKSDLGLNPSNDGSIIRIAIPQLTQERRLELVKVAKKKAEDTRVNIRNIRRDANDNIKVIEKDKIVSEDDAKKGQDDIQKLTDKYIKELDGVLNIKEKEIMEV